MQRKERSTLAGYSARQQKSGTSPRVKTTTESEFLAACPENTRGFLSRLIADSKQRGFTISWGTKGFSVRITNAAGKLESLFYAYPPGLDGASQPVFQAYVGYIKDEDRHRAARKAFTSEVPFHLRGKHTLQVELDETGLQAAEHGLSALLETGKRIESGETLTYEVT